MRSIARCVEPDPAARFQTSAELAAALAALDEDGQTAAGGEAGDVAVADDRCRRAR